MIVKIVEAREDGIAHESIYECETVIMNSVNQVYGSIDIVQSSKCQTIDINKKTDTIYLMNNNGKTIETYRW